MLNFLANIHSLNYHSNRVYDRRNLVWEFITNIVRLGLVREIDRLLPLFIIVFSLYMGGKSEIPAYHGKLPVHQRFSFLTDIKKTFKLSSFFPV